MIFPSLRILLAIFTCVYRQIDLHIHTRGHETMFSLWLCRVRIVSLSLPVCIGIAASDLYGIYLSALILISLEEADLFWWHGLTVKDNLLLVAADWWSGRSALVVVAAAAASASRVDTDYPASRSRVHWDTDFASNLTDRDERLNSLTNQPDEPHTNPVSRAAVTISCRKKKNSLSWCHTESRCSTLWCAEVVMMETTLPRDWLFVYLFGVSG